MLTITTVGQRKMKNFYSIVEALVCNFELDNIGQHNHGKLAKKRIEQLKIFEFTKEQKSTAHNKGLVIAGGQR